MTATLLLADDSPTIQRVIELTFADEDVRVVAVGDGNAAIARIEEQPPDIVLADVGMPFKTGYEVSSYVKHSPRLSHIPVILLTGAFEPIDQHKADEARCDGVLAKPFDPQLVIARVKELLARPRAGASGPEPLASRPAPVSAPEQAAAVPASAAAPVPASASESMGDFFDRLDEAFANLPAAQRVMVAPEPVEEDAGTAPPFTPPPVPPTAAAEEADNLWDIELPPLSDRQLPSFLGPPTEAHRVAAPPPSIPAAAAHIASPSVGAPASPPSPAVEKPAMPALADAFATLLAAEEPGAAPANMAAWVRPPIVTDELVERVAERVLERLSERAVHETTAEVVSPIVARLVLEEIDRIKAAIKDL
ncbi:MAG: response regulator [Acidobacteriota bacterium]